MAGRARVLPQYVAAAVAAFGAAGTGTMLAWIAPAGPQLIAGEYPFEVTINDEAWIGSLAILGAAFACFPVGFSMEKLGRKLTMLLMVVPSTAGWLLIALAANVPMLYVGRFIMGIGAGSFSVTVPAYNNEIVTDNIRGTVGIFFQLLMNVGVLLVYCVGGYAPLFVLSMVCAAMPLLFGVMFLLAPESPYHLLRNDRVDEAREALVKLRGREYDVDAEIQTTQKRIVVESTDRGTFKERVCNRPTIKALIIAMVLVALLQFSGINAIIFNAIYIFETAGADISPEVSSIIIGVMQVLGTFFASVVVDRSGRKALLLISAGTMVLCGVGLGVYFHLNERDPAAVASVRWLPLVLLCVFVVAFSVGCGPVPWLMSAELSAPRVRALVMATCGTTNWLLGFVVTRTYNDMKLAFGLGGVYWFFAACTLAGGAFVALAIPETKGRTNEEIRERLDTRAVHCGS